MGAKANWQGGVQANKAIQTNHKWKERSMLLNSGKFTGGYHESDLSRMPNFPFYVLLFFSRICDLLHFNNNELMGFLEALSLEVDFTFRGCRLLLPSNPWQEQAPHKPACTVCSVPTHSELTMLILCPEELRPDNCQVNKHKPVRNQTHLHLGLNSTFESWFKKVKC